MKFKSITHFAAVVIAAVSAFVLTPAGQAVLAQYPKLATIGGGIGAILALYHSPKTSQGGM